MSPCHLGKKPDVGKGEDERPLDKTMNDEFVRRWIDPRNTGMMAFEVKIGRRDRSGEILQRRE
jgi:hypothetical protein